MAVMLGALVLGTGLTAPTSALAQTQQQSEDARRDARVAVEQGRYGEALALVQGPLQRSPDDRPLLLLRARAYEGIRQYARAQRDYERVLQLDPGNEEARAGMERLRPLLDSGAAGRLDALRAAAASNPDDLSAQLVLADALYQAAIYRDAAAAYERYLGGVTQAAPDAVQRYLISVAQYDGGEAEAERIAERYLTFYPTSDDLYMRLGFFRYWQDKYASAIEACEQALRLNPQNDEAARCVRLARDPGSGEGSQFPIDILTAELRADPDQPEKRLELAQLLTEAGRYNEAVQNLEAMPRRYRSDPEWKRLFDTASTRLAAASPRQNQQGEFIIDRLTRELALRPNQPEKRFRLAEELVRYDRFFEAYEQLTELAEQYDETPRWLELFDDIDDGLIRANGESPVYFIDRLTYRLRLDPSNPSLRLELAEALLSVDRVFEAEDVLTVMPYEGRDNRYTALQAEIAQQRRLVAARRIAELERALQIEPGDLAAQRDLGAEYFFAGRTDEAIALLGSYLQRRPGDDLARLRYGLALQQIGAYDDALQTARFLLREDAQSADAQRLYALSALALERDDPDADRYVSALLARNPGDTGFLLDLSTFALRRGEPDLAERYWTQAYASRDPFYQERLTQLWGDIQDVRLGGPERFTPILEDARALFADSLYDQSVQRYALYFQQAGGADRAGALNRGLLIEYAQALSAGQFYSDAIAVFERVQEEAYEVRIAQEVARNQYARGDYAGTILTLEEARDVSRSQGSGLSRDGLLLLADAYREGGQYRDADDLYRTLLLYDPEDTVIAERIVLLDAWTTYSVSENSSQNDFAAVVAPTLEATVADGSGTRYQRWAPGTLAQITLPAPVIFSAGIMSHYIEGTRRLVRDAETVSTKINEVFVGGWVDITPPVAELDNPLTNRISANVGVHDYEGRRSVPFFEARYWHHTPSIFAASVGVRSTEGSIELWSPAGGEFELRLNQVDLRGSTSGILPDSLVRVAAYIAFNRVTDTFTLDGSQTTNYGIVGQVDASLRLLPRWWTGLTFYYTGYEFGTDLYFSPSDFRSYDLWLEYLKRSSNGNLYWRTRGSVGLVSRSAGFISTRLETEVTYRINKRLSWVFSGSVSRSARRFSSADVGSDRYDIFTLSTQLYWTLL